LETINIEKIKKKKKIVKKHECDKKTLKWEKIYDRLNESLCSGRGGIGPIRHVLGQCLKTTVGSTQPNQSYCVYDEVTPTIRRSWTDFIESWKMLSPFYELKHNGDCGGHVQRHITTSRSINTNPLGAGKNLTQINLLQSILENNPDILYV
jgi:hypothetical protein